MTYYASALLLQSCPNVSSPAPLVVPNTAKLDIERLLRDLPKFKPWVNADSWKWWESFIMKIDDLDKVQDIPWELPKLCTYAMEAEKARKEVACNSISAETTRLLEKETASCAKVCFVECLHTMSHIPIFITTDSCCKEEKKCVYYSPK